MPTVAIVEDDQAIVQMYRMKFVAEGFEVHTASDGAEGLEIIKQHKPDIVLLDLMMPTMTGDEMLSKLRATNWGKDIKVIVLTNMGEAEAPASVKGNSVEGFIVKAEMTPKQVTETVKSVLDS